MKSPVTTLQERDGIAQDGAVVSLPVETRKRRIFSRALTAIPLVLGLGMWIMSLGAVRTEDLDSYGLMRTLPLAWYGSLVIIITGSVLALVARQPSSTLLGAYGMVLVLVLFTTIPIVADLPQYAWTYKHIGVTRYIELHGSVDRSVDIYHRWPGFFALAAFFAKLSGHENPVTFAAWAEPAFAALGLFFVYLLGRRLLGGTRTPWLAAYIFTATNWIGQCYFAPQALGLALALAMYVVIVGELAPARANLVVRFLAKNSMDLRVPAPTLPHRSATAVVIILYSAVVVSHQLSPIMIVLTVGTMTLFGLVRPRWLFLVMFALLILHTLPNLGYVNDNFGLLKIDPFSNAAEDGIVVPLQRLPGKIVYARAGLALVFGLWLLTVLAVLTRFRQGPVRSILVPVTAIVGCSLVFFMQPYGGEGRLRIYLFSAPWCALLVAPALVSESRSRFVNAVRAGGVLLVSAALWVCAFMIPFDVNKTTPDELAAAEWVYDNVDVTIPISFAGPNFPEKYNPNYAASTRLTGSGYTLLEDYQFRTTSFGRDRRTEIDGIIQYMMKRGTSGYLIFSTREAVYADSFGLAPPNSLRRIESEVAVNVNFERIFANPDVRVYIFKYRGT